MQPALGDRGRVLGPHRARGGVARVDQRLVRVRLVVRGERRAQHHGLAADLDAAAGVDALRHAVGQRADEHGHVVAGRPVPAGDRPGEPPVLVDERQRQPVELGHHDHRLAREPVEERLDLLGLGRLLQREHRPRVPDRRVQHGRRADLLERIRVRRELGMLGDQRRAARPRSRRTRRPPPTASRGSTRRAARRSDRRVPGSARGCSSPAPYEARGMAREVAAGSLLAADLVDTSCPASRRRRRACRPGPP